MASKRSYQLTPTTVKTGKYIPIDGIALAATESEAIDATLFPTYDSSEGNLELPQQAVAGTNTHTFAQNLTFDMDNGNVQQTTITNDVLSLAITNEVNGASYLIYLIQDGVGGHAIPTPGASFGTVTDSSSAFVTAANDVNIININIRPDGTTYYTVETVTA